MGGKARQKAIETLGIPEAWVSFSRMMKPEDLVAVMVRLIVENNLHKLHGEDTIGVLMRCSAFWNVEVSILSNAIDRHLKIGRWKE